MTAKALQQLKDKIASYHETTRAAFLKGLTDDFETKNPYPPNWGFHKAYESGRTFAKINGKIEYVQLNLL